MLVFLVRGVDEPSCCRARVLLEKFLLVADFSGIFVQCHAPFLATSSPGGCQLAKCRVYAAVDTHLSDGCFRLSASRLATRPTGRQPKALLKPTSIRQSASNTRIFQDFHTWLISCSRLLQALPVEDE
eukprot:TRINITY_DN11796_c0_g1_i4.p1 TRINITY_DN11796_c0_g1~~TRINITY_DN11796_c0_g1_i4.p1  ORF type:complete len:128 (-),score=9.10 TRINITY_DN11796_c0_g1_i4:300-683(-)